MLTRTLLAAFLIVVIPISDIRVTRWLKNSADPARKLKAYLGTLVILWLASFAVWASEHPGFAYPMHPGDKVKGLTGNPLVAGAAVGMLFALVVQVFIIRRRPKLAEAAFRQMQKLDFFLPFTRRERACFAAVSITAGICEETLYRGFLYHYFRDTWHWGVLLAVLASAIVFGLAHGYQGVSGIAATGFIGAVLAAVYLATGSLILPMVLHAIMDLRILLFPVPGMAQDALPAAGV